MSKTIYRSVWVSDVHLCSKDSHSGEFLAFLKSIKCENLYLVGDIVDIWQLRRRWFWPQDANNILRKVLSKARNGTRVTYIPGNHDEGLRHFCGTSFGSILLADEVVHDCLDGRRILVTHGDQFDAVVKYNKWLAMLGSAAYDYLVRANIVLNRFRRWMGLGRWSLAAAVKRNVKKVASYLDCYEATVAAHARTRGVDGIVCGHVHTPCIKDIGSVTYMNCGDWVENCCALVETLDGRFEVVYWGREQQPSQ